MSQFIPKCCTRYFRRGLREICPFRRCAYTHDFLGLGGKQLWLNHAADGVDGKLVDDPGLWSNDVHALELICSRREAFLELGDFPLGVAQVPLHLGAKILVELDDLQLDFTDLAARPGHFRNKVAAICGEIMTMPGLPRVPAADSIDVGADGRIVGLF